MNSKERLEQILNNIKEFIDSEYHEKYSKYNFYNKNYCWYKIDGEQLYNTKNDIFELNLEDNYGGEGQGEEYWFVYKYKDEFGENYIRFNGCYDSWNGVEWTDPELVEPQEKVIIVYNTI